MSCFADFISLNNVSVTLQMLVEDHVHLRHFAFSGVCVSHYEIKSLFTGKYTDKYTQVYLGILFVEWYFSNYGFLQYVIDRWWWSFVSVSVVVYRASGSCISMGKCVTF